MSSPSLYCPCEIRSLFLSWSLNDLVITVGCKLGSQVSFWLSCFHIQICSGRSLWLVLLLCLILQHLCSDHIVIVRSWLLPTLNVCYHIWHIYLEKAQNKMNTHSLTNKEFTSRKPFPFLSVFAWFISINICK